MITKHSTENPNHRAAQQVVLRNRPSQMPCRTGARAALRSRRRNAVEAGGGSTYRHRYRSPAHERRIGIGFHGLRAPVGDGDWHADGDGASFQVAPRDSGFRPKACFGRMDLIRRHCRARHRKPGIPDLRHSRECLTRAGSSSGAIHLLAKKDGPAGQARG